MTRAEVLDWTCNPWRERPGRALTALLAAPAAFLLVRAAWDSALAAGALALAVAASVAPAWLPVRCHVDAAGVAVRGPFGWERRAWDDIRRAVPVAAGVLVSPFRSARRLDRFRALVLPLPVAGREPLERELVARLAEHGIEHA